MRKNIVTETSTLATQLAALPRSEFTAVRNARAKELGGDEGARVKALPKPTTLVWALNAGVRAKPTAAKELVKLATAKSASSKDKAAKFDELVAELTRAAISAAGGGDRSKISSAYRAAPLADPEAFVEARMYAVPSSEDTLEAALTASGATASSRRAPSPRITAAQQRKARAQERADAKQAVKDADAAAREAARTVERLERELEAARTELEDANTIAERAAARVDELT